MLYQLMNKNVIVATYEEVADFDDYRYTPVEQLDSYLPHGFTGIDDWIDGRQIAKHRASIMRLMRELGLNTRHDFICMARCLLLTDTFWMKGADECLSWADVSLYRNPFDDVIVRIAFDGTGMYRRENSPTSPEFATSGSFAKCWIREGIGYRCSSAGPRVMRTRGSSPIPRRSPRVCSRRQGSITCPTASCATTGSSRVNARCSRPKASGSSRRTVSSRGLSMLRTCSGSACGTAPRRASARWS